MIYILLISFREEIREQIVSLKREYHKDKKEKDAKYEKDQQVQEEKQTTNELMQKYISEQEKYSHLKKDLPKKGSLREQHTLALLSKFKSKLEKVKETQSTEDDDSELTVETKKVELVRDIASDNEDDIAGDDWLSHTLRFENKAPVLAKDASTKKDDWYDAFDPRNPLNKRKRGDGGDRSRKRSPRR